MTMMKLGLVSAKTSDLKRSFDHKNLHAPNMRKKRRARLRMLKKTSFTGRTQASLLVRKSQKWDLVETS